MQRKYKTKPLKPAKTKPAKPVKQKPAKPKVKPWNQQTRGEKVITWIEETLYVPEGKQVAQMVVLRPWQREAILEIYDNPHGTRRAILSFGRKNGKTALAAMLVLTHLCGPERGVNSQLFSAAQSREQASLVFGLAAKMVRMSQILEQCVSVRDTRKELFFKLCGNTYRALSAEATTAYGLSPRFIIHDELGQVRGPTSPLYEALETATAAQEDPLSIIISTQAPNDGDLLSILIDDALAGHDPKTVVKLYTTPPEDDPFVEANIRKANPAYGDFQTAKEVMNMAENAKRMPARENEYRNLVLNQRVEAQSPFISVATWKACGEQTIALNYQEPIYGGLDLSAVNDLTALVLVQKPDTAAKWQVHPTFWLPHEGLHERSRVDRVPYDLWAKHNNLITVPGRSIEYEYVADHIVKLLDKGLPIKAIAFDKWNFKTFRPWLVKAGMSEAQVESLFVEFGQNFSAMSPALRELETAILNSRLAHGMHPVMNMCAQNAVVISDPNGNRKLAKNRSVGRIDGMVALAMALSITSNVQVHVAEPSYQMFVIA